MATSTILSLLVCTASAQVTTTGAQTTKLCTGEETKSGPCFFKVTYRDFQAEKMPNTRQAPNIFQKYNPDFESGRIRGNRHQQVNGLLKKFLNQDHKPELSDHYPQMHSPDWFATWFDECAGPAGPGLTCGATRKQCLKRTPNGIPCGYSYRFDSQLQVNYNAVTRKYSFKTKKNFLPLSNSNCPTALVNGRCGWGHQPSIYRENYGFTTEMNLLFKFKGGETFRFSGDDDLWVFIGSRLAVDIGGLHSPVCKTLQLPEAGCQTCQAVVRYCGGRLDYKYDASYLKVGQTYRFDLFHAERHSTGSNFNFETTLDLKEDTCKGFLQQLKAGAYASPDLDPGLLVTDESCPAEKFEFEDREGSSFCDIRKCKPGYEAVGTNYLRLTCDGDKLRSFGKGFKCRKITGSTTTSPSGNTPSTTIAKDSTTATTTTTPTSSITKTTPSLRTSKPISTTSPDTASAESSTTMSSSSSTVATTDKTGTNTLVNNVNPQTSISSDMNNIVREVDSGVLPALSGVTIMFLAIIVSSI